MGQLKSDGRATQGGYTIPAGTYAFGELFRINGWNGIILKSVAAGDTVRAADMEISSERIWIVKVPAITAGIGDYLYWTVGAASVTKRGDTDLTATENGSPVCKVEETKDANGYAAVRVLNVGPTPVS